MTEATGTALLRRATRAFASWFPCWFPSWFQGGLSGWNDRGRSRSPYVGGVGIGLLWVAAGIAVVTPSATPRERSGDAALQRMMEPVDRGAAIALSADASGDVWWITAERAIRFEAGAPSQPRTAIDLRDARGDFAIDPDPIAAAHVGLDGTLFLGTRRGAVWSHRDGAWRNLAGATGGTRVDAISAIVTLGDEVYVAGTGLWRGPREGPLEEVPAFSGTAVSHAVARPDFGVAVIARGRAWRSDASGWRAIWSTRLGGDSVSALAIAPDGELWIGTHTGLVRIDRDGRETRDLVGTPIVSVALGEDGAAYVGSRGAGLFARYAKGWRPVDAAGVRGVTHVARLAPTADGALWLALGSGDLLRASPAARPLAHVSSR